jgi:hypothetical protein
MNRMDVLYTVSQAEADHASHIGYTAAQGPVAFVFPPDDLPPIAAGPITSSPTGPAPHHRPPGTIPLFRLRNAPGGGDHFYTSNGAEARGLIQQGWADEGISCFIYSSVAGIKAGARPFERVNANGSHIYGVREPIPPGHGAPPGKPPPPGWVYEGVVGYVLDHPEPGTVPLWACALFPEPDHTFDDWIMGFAAVTTGGLINPVSLGNPDIGVQTLLALLSGGWTLIAWGPPRDCESGHPDSESCST